VPTRLRPLVSAEIGRMPGLSEETLCYTNEKIADEHAAQLTPAPQ